MTVDLTKQEWDMVMAVLAKAPWDVANPLLMKIGGQLQQAQALDGARDHAEKVARLMQADSGALKPKDLS